MSNREKAAVWDEAIAAAQAKADECCSCNVTVPNPYTAEADLDEASMANAVCPTCGDPVFGWTSSIFLPTMYVRPCRHWVGGIVYDEAHRLQRIEPNHYPRLPERYDAKDWPEWPL